MRLSSIVGGLSIAILSTVAAQAEPSIVNFDIPGTTGVTRPTAISDKGDIAGEDMAGGAFIRHADGSFETFNIDSAQQVVPTAINKQGSLVGYYWLGQYARGFLRQPDGTVTTFHVPYDPAQNFPTTLTATGTIMGRTGDYIQGKHGISGYILSPDGRVTEVRCHCGAAFVTGGNNLGVAIGSSLDSKNAFVRSPDGTVTVFNVGGFSSGANAINDAGMIVGAYANLDTQTEDGFVRAADGTITVFAVNQRQPDRVTHTDPLAINAHGVIAGQYEPEGESLGFVRDQKGMITIFEGKAGAQYTSVAGINSKGVIAGSAHSSENGYSGYLRTP